MVFQHLKGHAAVVIIPAIQCLLACKALIISAVLVQAAGLPVANGLCSDSSGDDVMAMARAALQVCLHVTICGAICHVHELGMKRL